MRLLTNFYDFWFKQTAIAAIGIHPTQAWESQLVNFKNAIWNFRRTIWLLLDHLAWIEHQFLIGIRDSRKTESLWGIVRGVGGVRKSMHQSWEAKGLGLRLLGWGFKGVLEEILSEEACALQIGSVAYTPGQYPSPQLHPCHRLFDQDPIYQPLRSGRIWHKLNFLSGV